MALRDKRRGGDRDAVASLLSRLSCDAREFSFGATGDSDSDDDSGDIIASSRESRATAVPRIAISHAAARSYAETEASVNAYRAGFNPSSGSSDPPIVLSPLEFYRDYVAANRPCVITGAVSHWPALSLWQTDQYLIDALGEKRITVDFTPDGHGDAIVWRDGIGRSEAGSGEQAVENSGSGCNTRGKGRASSGCDRRSGDDSEVGDGEIIENLGVGRWVLFPGEEGWDSRERREEMNRRDEEAQREEAEAEVETEATGEGVGEAGREEYQRERECEAAECFEGNNCSCGGTCSGGCGGSSCDSIPRACRCESPCAWFVTPHEASLTLPTFLRLLYSSRSSPSHSPSHLSSHSPSLAASHPSRSPFIGIPYVQHQNGSFRTEFAALAADADEHVGFATAALGGNLPEAVNLWIGDERAVTSWHKDHYENFYVVVTGRKTFRLLPPLDVFRMRVREYPAAKYWRAEDERGPFHILPSDPPCMVPWASVDAALNPLIPCPHALGASATAGSADGGSSEELKRPPPLVCTIGPGEMLFLPSMWYHHVSQSPGETGRTIALNYWYDMQFDVKYAYFNLVQSLTRLYRL